MTAKEPWIAVLSIHSHPVQEAEAQGELVQLVGENGTADFDDGKLVGRREDAQVPFDFLARSERVQKTSDGLLRGVMRRSVRFMHEF